MPRIVLIEDELDLQQVLEYNLRQAGHEVFLAGRGDLGLSLCKKEHPDLVLLDLMLPDMGGTEICRILKGDPATSAIPVVMLTAKSEEIDRVTGFQLGADDYVTKPFSIRELLLRIQAVLRRSTSQTSQSSNTPTQQPDERVIEFGILRIDKDAHRVWVERKEIELTALEFRLLCQLVSQKNRVQTRSALLGDVWHIEADITTRTVDTHVKRLREKLGPAGRYIETVRGTGYRFAESPEELPR